MRSRITSDINETSHAEISDDNIAAWLPGPIKYIFWPKEGLVSYHIDGYDAGGSLQIPVNNVMRVQVFYSREHGYGHRYK